MRKILFVFISFLISANIFAQPKEEIHLIKGYTYSATLPFELIQDLIVINNIIINGQKGSFVFDTGNQSALVLNSASFQREINREFNKSGIRDTARGITGNIPVTTSIRIDTLTLTDDFTFGGLNAIAFDLENVKAEIGKNFLGFIGYGVMRELEFAIDYEKKLLHIYRLSWDGNTMEEPFYKKNVLLNFVLDKGLITSRINYAGKLLNFFLDTGAPKNSLDALTARNLDKNYIEYTGIKDTIRGAEGGTMITDDVLMKQFTIKDVVFSDMTTNVHPFQRTITYNVILGYPFFKQKVFAINYMKRQLYICE